MAMFRCKKDTVMKYSRTLSEHFRSTSKVAQAPSPCVARQVVESLTFCLCNSLRVILGFPEVAHLSVRWPLKL